eukprot:m.72372 g.72372  ORF g.72372 m.72372 type:complete len:386 (-) comp12333_c0_seq2:241-1398(-)
MSQRQRGAMSKSTVLLAADVKSVSTAIASASSAASTTACKTRLQFGGAGNSTPWTYQHQHKQPIPVLHNKIRTRTSVLPPPTTVAGTTTFTPSMASSTYTVTQRHGLQWLVSTVLLALLQWMYVIAITVPRVLQHARLNGIRAIITHALFGWTTHPSRAYHALCATLKAFPKKCEHLCLVFDANERGLTMDTVAELAICSLASTPKTLVLWDNTGLLSQSKRELEKQLVAKWNRVATCSTAATPQEQTNAVRPPFVLDGQNGLSGSRETESEGESPALCRIYVASPEDGRQHIVNTVRQRASAAKHSETALDPLSVDDFGHLVMDNVPELDLVLMFHNKNTLEGLLPWQLRVAELVTVGPALGATANSIRHAFAVFAKCEKRLGT